MFADWMIVIIIVAGLACMTVWIGAAAHRSRSVRSVQRAEREGAFGRAGLERAEQRRHAGRGTA